LLQPQSSQPDTGRAKLQEVAVYFGEIDTKGRSTPLRVVVYANCQPMSCHTVRADAGVAVKSRRPEVPQIWGARLTETGGVARATLRLS